ncbi:hypothetical protein [Chryseobacterium sp.]|uniref:hypothetical protein n=1 Tax=Chryseobacterium sp. TaxID=1871047 RepID=UPI000ECF28ED|nr:hypothetical protein [Chryseobacterium sp.]HCA06999.1 hypothetical protein [Chryseobacterium sp.]
MKKTFLSLVLTVAFGSNVFAAVSNNENHKSLKSVSIDDVKFLKGLCTMRLTYTNPNTGQSTSWIESYETATAEDCGKLLASRLKQLSDNAN